MKKTPHKEDGNGKPWLRDDIARNDKPWTPAQIDDLAKQLIRWSKLLDKTKGADAGFRKRLAAIAVALTCTGCQTFPTLTHPRSGGDYSFWSEMPYYNPYARPFYPGGYYEDAPISRNDFIIAAEAAQAR